MVAALVAVAGCRSEPHAKAPKAGEDRERGADWDKVNRDAARMEEKSRQRAEKQREQALQRANKESGKE
jgi:hypothetical protein